MIELATKPQPTLEACGISRRRVATLLASLPLVATTAPAQGQFPDRPVRLIVPYGPGTGTDALARRLAAVMPGLIGQTMTVENRPGANAFIGAETAARSAPDGYTLILSTDHVMCYNPALFKSLPYNPTKDFAPVAGLTSHPHLLVVSPDVPAKSVAELVALAKAKPGTLSVASTGVGTAAHLVGEIFKREAGIDILHVPYPGATQLFSDLLSGRTSMLFYPYQAVKPYLETGKLRALGNASERRAAWLRDVPTMGELGYPRTVMAAWLAVYAPAGTPADRVARLADAFKKAVDMPEVSSQLLANGIDIQYRPPAELAAFTASQMNRCQDIVRLSGAKVE